MQKTTVLGRLERLAALLRRAGLGRPVDVVRTRLARLFASSVEVDGLRVHGRLEHLAYLREIAAGRERLLGQILDGLLKPGMRVLDAGAHVGYVTVRAARAVGPSGHVVAVEPNPRTHDVLRRNVAANGFDDRVTIVARALGARAERRPFFLSSGGDASGLVAPADPVAEVAVDVVTADEALGHLGPFDVIKLDLEGGEPAALRGMERLLAEAEDMALIVEWNPTALVAAGARVEDLVTWLEERRFRLHVLDEAAGAVRGLDRAQAVDGYVNMLALRGSFASAAPVPATEAGEREGLSSQA